MEGSFAFKNDSATEYIDFFNTWGTHVAIQLRIGGRFGYRSSFTGSQYTSMVASGLDVSASAGFYVCKCIILQTHITLHIWVLIILYYVIPYIFHFKCRTIFCDNVRVDITTLQQF